MDAMLPGRMTTGWASNTEHRSSSATLSPSTLPAAECADWLRLSEVARSNFLLQSEEGEPKPR